MKSKEEENIIFVKLFTNEKIFEKLNEVCSIHNIKTAVIISGIGQLKNFKIGYFKEKGNYLTQSFHSPYELLSLNGNICKNNDDYIMHLHVVLGDKNKNTIGGHLIEGMVEVTNEIIILKSNLEVNRIKEESTGLMSLNL
jgi:predicted DNA-binding protein with PD1-like motif